MEGEKLSDLRRNNLLEVSGNIWTVDSIIGDDSELYFKENIDYNHILNAVPILLTEEWLLKFGFELKENSFQDDLLDTFMFHKDNIVDVEFSDKHKKLYWHDNYSPIYHQDIFYVHQLQNLYHILIGQELFVNK